MPRTGIEPASHMGVDFESTAYTSSANRAGNRGSHGIDESKIHPTASTIIRKTIAAPKTVHKRATVWHVRLDSNEHPPVLETGTLPVELLT